MFLADRPLNISISNYSKSNASVSSILRNLLTEPFNKLSTQTRTRLFASQYQKLSSSKILVTELGEKLRKLILWTEKIDPILGGESDDVFFLT